MVGHGRQRLRAIAHPLDDEMIGLQESDDDFANLGIVFQNADANDTAFEDHGVIAIGFLANDGTERCWRPQDQPQPVICIMVLSCFHMERKSDMVAARGLWHFGKALEAFR